VHNITCRCHSTQGWCVWLLRVHCIRNGRAVMPSSLQQLGSHDLAGRCGFCKPAVLISLLVEIPARSSPLQVCGCCCALDTCCIVHNITCRCHSTQGWCVWLLKVHCIMNGKPTMPLSFQQLGLHDLAKRCGVCKPAVLMNRCWNFQLHVLHHCRYAGAVRGLTHAPPCASERAVVVERRAGFRWCLRVHCSRSV
jgi:hypothetical protein